MKKLGKRTLSQAETVTMYVDCPCTCSCSEVCGCYCSGSSSPRDGGYAQHFHMSASSYHTTYNNHDANEGMW